MGRIKVMTPEDGDKHIVWDPSDEKGVSKAKKEFDKLKKKGHRIFKVSRKPQRTGNEVSEFDAGEHEYIVLPPMAGG